MAILDLPHWGLLTTTLLSCLASPALSAPHQLGSNQSSAQPVRIPMGQSFHGPTWNLTYGSPPQTMVMLDDWTWQSTWLYSPNCKGSYSVPNCVMPGQNFFDYEKSSSFHQTSDAVQSFNGTDYAPGLPFTFNFGTDQMCLPDRDGRDDICKSKIEVEISDLPYEFPVVEDIGGIFGYSPVLPEFNATFFPAPYQFMQAGLLSNIVGWHMCTALKNKRSCSNQDYLTILGGTDTSVYHPQSMQDHPIVVTPCINAGNLNLSPARDNYWSASWTGLWMGNTAISLSAPSTGQPPSQTHHATVSPRCYLRRRRIRERRSHPSRRLPIHRHRDRRDSNQRVRRHPKPRETRYLFRFLRQDLHFPNFNLRTVREAEHHSHARHVH
ncbi:hypothetical protein ABVK25_010121 [Lepraria finkii]|uniref:Peptidase A1 domain-containing protein n=1 Tax=Lepraria finkii TaxID=1340010 RepID=A0ABR4AVP8_9LECA